MVPLSLVIIFILIQCLFNLFSTAVLSKESRGKDEVIENLYKKLMEKDEVISKLSTEIVRRK